MALLGQVPIKNCSKKYTVYLFLEDSANGQRGDNCTGDFVCNDLPESEGKQISDFWEKPYFDLNIDVVKTFEEVREHPEEGIDVNCLEDCPFNTNRRAKEL